MGPDGAIYAGGLGADGNWGQEAKLKFGLQKLTPNGGNTFDIKEMRAVAGGFDLEYTQPVSKATAEEPAKRYQAEQWRYTPTSDYGGPKIAEERLAVRSATLTDDGRTVRLRLDGLEPGRVVHVRSPRPFASESGETLWSTEAWYTLNALPGEQPPAATLYEAEEARITGTAGINTDHTGYSGSSFVDRYATEGKAAHGAAVTLFDGTAASRGNWQHTDGRRVEWPLTAEDSMEVCCGDIRTKDAHQDFGLHVEFRVPRLPDDVTGQDHGNSGIYLQDRYELQVLDSYGDTTPGTDEAGAIYLKKAPDVNAATPPETWQTYDVTFRAARFDADGTKTADARVTVVWNGRTVHDDVAIGGPTGGGAPEGPSAGAIRLQDHGNKARFRDIRVEPLS